MKTPADMRAVVAVDLGAQSCRFSLLRWTTDGPHIELVHRISNAPVLRDGDLRWDLAGICSAADEGLRRCAEIAEEGIAAIGVTGWAVDYVRLDDAGLPIADPFCYRDSRTAAAMEAVHSRISAERLYALTGIQVHPINTLYQLFADSMAGIPSHLRWLNLPEYMLYRWGARPVGEHTNASHTAMVSSGTRRWCDEIFTATGLDISAAPEIVAPGTTVGRLHGALSKLPALRDTVLIAPACHDTASAIAGIPAEGHDWAYISSGTWSLVGTVLTQPCAGPNAAQFNFTNEAGAGGTICFLRNVNGLWLLQQCMEHWNAQGNATRQQWTAESLVKCATSLPSPSHLFDVDDPELLAPGNMPDRIGTLLVKQHGNPASEFLKSPPAVASLILHSLAARYAQVLHQAESLTEKHFKRLYIVGGGSQNRLLNQLTSRATGLPVLCGSVESSTLGNFAVQLAALQFGSANSDAIAHWAHTLAMTATHPNIPTHQHSNAPSPVSQSDVMHSMKEN